MAEVVSHLAFTQKEVAEALVRYHGLSDGVWGLYIEFGIGAVNLLGATPDDLTPAAVVPVLKIGLQRFKELNSISVDAAKVDRQTTANVAVRPRGRKRA